MRQFLERLFRPAAILLPHPTQELSFPVMHLAFADNLGTLSILGQPSTESVR
jgi:hypothetical protein